ncbi:MAG: hypothetical protein AB7Q42_09805 [Acidimicrobiia bacterium]
METTTTVQFADAARALSRAARERGLGAPTFRSPPRVVGVDRSVRRYGDHAVVAVRLRGRPWVAVAADMVEGVIVANRLEGPAALRVRGALWSSLGFATATDEPRSTAA